MAFETVVFNEGAPLDPDTLTKLQSNITSVYSQQGLLNTTVTGLQGQVTSSFTDSGRVNITGMSKDKWTGSVTVPVSSSFTKNAAISVTSNQQLSAGEVVTFYTAQVENGSFKIFAQSSGSRSTLWVHYIITDKKTVSS
jgi:hypothetical protein